MNVEVSTLRNILEDRGQFRVPLIQRKYVWRETTLGKPIEQQNTDINTAGGTASTTQANFGDNQQLGQTISKSCVENIIFQPVEDFYLEL
jgi:hypothetical protein